MFYNVYVHRAAHNILLNRLNVKSVAQIYTAFDFLYVVRCLHITYSLINYSFNLLLI